MDCGACRKPCNNDAKSESVISCSKCFTDYHALCLNMTREEQKTLRTKKQFVCPNCKLKSKSVKSDSTPVRSNQPKPQPENEDEQFLSSTKKLTTMEIPSEALSSFTAAISELVGIFKTMKNEMCEFTKSLNFFSAEISTFREELSGMKARIKETDKLQSEIVCLRAEVADLRQAISTKEQRQILKNVEISGLPEEKSENLQQKVHLISTKLGVELDPRDVEDVRRVGARRDESTANPRPVVLSFVRRAPRDQLLRAARVRRGLTTESLELPGTSRRIYINEHLTKENRILFGKARKLGTDLHFKYTWTSNGNIFMRRSDTSSVLHVTSEEILSKLTPRIQPSTPRGVEQNCS